MTTETQENTTIEEVAKEAAEALHAEQEVQQEAAPSLEEENAKLKDQLLRAMAEVENMRRRVTKEKEEAHKFAVSKFAKDLIAVAENMERAEAAFTEELLQENEALASLKEGVVLTAQALQKAFAAHGMRKLSPKGEAFDHNLHEALAQVPSAEAEEGTVIDVMQAGYTLHERLLQPARVVVAKKV